MTLGKKLSQTIEELKVAGIRQDQAMEKARLEKIRKERDALHGFIEDLKNDFIEKIEGGSIPGFKVTSYDRQRWISLCQHKEKNSKFKSIERRSGSNMHEDIWRKFVDWTEQQGLQVIVKNEHDGIGIDSWMRITAIPLFRSKEKENV